MTIILLAAITTAVAQDTIFGIEFRTTRTHKISSTHTAAEQSLSKLAIFLNMDLPPTPSQQKMSI